MMVLNCDVYLKKNEVRMFESAFSTLKPNFLILVLNAG